MTESGAVKVGTANAPEMATGTYRICGKCGATIFSEVAGELCPACLLESGLNEDASLSETEILREFGDYELIEEVGRGGQGVVYRARQKNLKRIVALKLIGLGSWATDAHLKRFRREAEAAASLDHSGIVPIYEFGERDGCCYFSMKLVEGEKLEEVIKRAPISADRAAHWIAKLARIVQHAHGRGILHRDIKPGNILFDRNGEPHLTDFGLARLLEAQSDVTSEFSGTPSYMAPEQAKNEALTPATDVYGLGAVLYQLLTGEPPFACRTNYETIRAVLETEPQRPRLLNSKVDVDLETICLKCLEKDPQHRYQTAAALAEDLDRWSRHEPTVARRIGVIGRSAKFLRRHRAIVIPLVLIGPLAAAVAVFLAQHEMRPGTSIAVLPFQNLSQDKADSSFADAIQDDLLTKLARIPDLKVISRTSVMQYRGEQNAPKIGRSLGVSHLLEGSVRKVGNRIHLNAQLIDTRNDSHVWAQEYDRLTSDLFAMQSELAQEIAGRLQTKLSRAAQSAIEKQPTKDMDAYHLYFRAKALSNALDADSSSGIDGLAEAVDLLEKAVARDPQFALAYCLLTETNLMLYWVPGRLEIERRARAEVALQAAQRLAPDAGETHLARALFQHYGNGDYNGALEEFELAARSLPNNADVFHYRARLERRLGRWSEALRHFSRASEIDPRNPTHLTDVAYTLLMLRRFDEAERTADRGIVTFPEAADQFRKVQLQSALGRGDLARARSTLERISNDPFSGLRFTVLFYERKYAEAEQYSFAQWQGKDFRYLQYFAILSAMAAHARGDNEKARTYLLAAHGAYESRLREQHVDPGVLAGVAPIDALLGKNEDALRESRRAVEMCPISQNALEGPTYAFDLARVYLWTGERERALEQLASLTNAPNCLTFGALKLDPIWDEVRGHPRFVQILADVAKPVSLP